MFNSYLHPVAAEGVGERAKNIRTTTRPPGELASGGPVLRIDAAGQVQSRSIPANTMALTFDDGPDPDWTPQILDLLAARGVHATFFVIGSKVNDYPELVRRMLAEGHEVGAHTFSHEEMASVPSWRRRVEMTLTANAIASATGRRATLFRPPYSSHPSSTTGSEFVAMRDVAEAGYLVVLADNDTSDWSKPGVVRIVRAATPTEGAGSIVMMHDGGGDRSETLDALDPLISDMEDRGYTFATVSEALGLPPAGPATAEVRWRGEALLWAQRGSTLLAASVEYLLVVALALPIIRLGMQAVTARAHARRFRRRYAQLRYLGPVSVIVPAYNEAANIAATVNSLVGNDYPCLEVIVVDDGSDDGTGDIVTQMNLPNVRVLRQPNLGKPAALNNGIAHAHFDLLVMVDGDTTLEPGAVGRLVLPFVDGAVGAVSGNTKVGNRRGVLGILQHLEYVIGFNLERRMFDVAGCVPTIPGAIGAFRKKALDDVRGVSADTLAEDTDLTMGVVRSGWQVVFAENAIAWTEAPTTLRQLWRQRYRWCYGVMQSMWKHRRSLVEQGPAGRLGRRALAYLLLFQILLPLIAPLVDLYAIYGLIVLPWTNVATVWLGALALQTMVAAYALRLDGERLRVLWALPLQQVLYRQVTYLVVVQSAVTALLGSRVRWHRSSHPRASPAAPDRPATRPPAPRRAAPRRAVTPRAVTPRAVTPPAGAESRELISIDPPSIMNCRS